LLPSDPAGVGGARAGFTFFERADAAVRAVFDSPGLGAAARRASRVLVRSRFCGAISSGGRGAADAALSAGRMNISKPSALGAFAISMDFPGLPDRNSNSRAPYLR
jgi:hypothetical protein